MSSVSWFLPMMQMFLVGSIGENLMVSVAASSHVSSCRCADQDEGQGGRVGEERRVVKSDYEKEIAVPVGCDKHCHVRVERGGRSDWLNLPADQDGRVGEYDFHAVVTA